MHILDRRFLAKKYFTEPLYKDHILTLELFTENYKSFYLHKPGTRIDSVHITESAGHLCIYGDLCPNDNRGVVSNPGYQIPWFSKPLSVGYMCSKFMCTEWNADTAEHELQELLDEAEEYDFSEKEREDITELIENIHDSSEEILCNDLWAIDLGYLLDDGTPGWGYNLRDAAILSAINVKFSKCFEEQNVIELYGLL